MQYLPKVAGGIVNCWMLARNFILKFCKNSYHVILSTSHKENISLT